MNLNSRNAVFLGALLLMVSSIQGQGSDSGCGGILNGMSGTGKFEAITADAVTQSNCIWIISPEGGNEVALTLKDISADSSILLYEVGHSEPLTILGPDSIDSSNKYPGKSFLAVFPLKIGSKVSFEWQMNGVSDDDESQPFDAFYSENIDESVLREYTNGTGSFAVVASLDQKYEIVLGISLRAASDDDSTECQGSCECLSAEAFEVLSSGRLNRLTPNRLCVGNRYDKLELKPQVVVWGDYKVPRPETDFLVFFTNWFTMLAPPTTTTPAMTTPPSTTPNFANSIFANKALVLAGLIVLYFPFQRYSS